MGAVGIVFSLMAIIQAIGFTLGMGSGTIVSLHLGAKEEEKATWRRSTGFFSAIVLGLALTVFGSLFVEPLMQVLGATETDSSLCKGLWTVHIAGGADYVRFLCDEQYFQVRREIRAWHAGNRHRRYPEYYPGSHFYFRAGVGNCRGGDCHGAEPDGELHHSTGAFLKRKE